MRVKLVIFYMLLIAFSNSEGFPSEPEGSEYQDLCIHNENEDKIQEELKEQQTVFNKMMSNIQAEMTEMKECLLRSEENIAEVMEEAKIVRVQPLHLMRSEENIAESISACTAALEESIQEAVDWANSQKEDNAGISDPGEDFIC